MKKYLMTGIAALAMGGLFTSCGPDMSVYNGDGTKAVVDKYEQAFVSAYGEPAANQTWGFGSSTVVGTRGMTRASDDYDGYKGSLQPMESYQDPSDGWAWKTRPLPFPSDCDASNFDPDLTGVKSYKEIADAANQGGGFATGICYIDENHTGKIHIWGGSTRAKLYFKAGNYDFTNETFIVEANADLYLLSGATLTLSDEAAKTAKFDVYIAPGAKLIANGPNGFKADVDAHIYNHGTIECSRFEVNNTSFLYNVGALTSSGDVYIANSISRVVNDGTINAASTHVEGSGALQNNAEWNVTGNTIVSCTNGGWVNNGHWKTQNYGYTAGSENVINNCFLEVTEDFDINTSQNSAVSFKIDTGCGVLTKNFNGGKVITDPNSVSGPYKIVMGNESVFKVTGTATLDGGNKGWGFFGPADGKYAVFQAKDVKRGRDHSQGMVTYGGNLYVSAETHFTNDDQYNPSIYFEAPFTISNIYAAGDNNFSNGNPDITIPTTPCNPGFGNSGSEGGEGGGETVKPVTESIRVIAEDLSAEDRSDFDFNDVVFDVFWTHTPGNDDKRTQSVKLKIYAAGGELPLFIGYADNPEWEIHTLLEAVNPNRGITTKTMMNTYENQHHAYNYREVDLPNDAWEGSEIGPIAKSINIYVRKSGNTYLLTAEKGEAACKIAVLQSFDPWCDEWEDINKRHQFSKYVTGELGDDEWY